MRRGLMLACCWTVYGLWRTRLLHYGRAVHWMELAMTLGGGGGGRVIES